MKSWRWNINGIFCALALIALLAGCQSSSKKEAKDATLMYFHLEATPDGNPKNQPVPVFRHNPQLVLINSNHFLSNADIVQASVVDVEGGFAIRVVFDRHGQLALENITASQKGKRIVIYAAFPEIRWLAAPTITRRITDGAFVFTPDATREESERIVDGLNKVAKKLKKQI